MFIIAKRTPNVERYLSVCVFICRLVIWPCFPHLPIPFPPPLAEPGSRLGRKTWSSWRSSCAFCRASCKCTSGGFGGFICSSSVAPSKSLGCPQNLVVDFGSEVVQRFRFEHSQEKEGNPQHVPRASLQHRPNKYGQHEGAPARQN